jgi:Ser/Thr protein kinase RdoA (MazF antagonist)
MKPFEELTYRGKLRRLRQVACAALDAYRLTGAQFTLITNTGNSIFRVYAPNPAPVKVAHELFFDNQYVLRIHQPGYQTAEEITSELEWLSALRCDAELPVPEPVPAGNGELLAKAASPGVPGIRNCSLLRWMKGRMLKKRIRSSHFRAVGRLMAKLHEHAAQWQPPKGFTRRHWDWDGLFGDTAGFGVPARVLWTEMPQPDVKPLEAVTRQVRQAMDELGKGKNVYGLIHSDLAVKDNMLFSGGEARAIDFDDCGYSYWMYDIAVTLSDWQETEAWPTIRDALLDGYREIRLLPEEQLAYLDLFMVARHATIMFWATGSAHLFPTYREGAYRWREGAARHVRRYINGL